MTFSLEMNDLFCEMLIKNETIDAMLKPTAELAFALVFAMGQ